jgi:hypothetical protein
VAMTRDEFVASLRAAGPEATAIIDENLSDHDGEVLLHLAVADLRRLALSLFEHADSDNLGRLLTALDQGLTEGDPEVVNAVGVSFVEDTGWWDQSTSAFIAGWPAGLRAEVERQRARRS